MNYLMIPHRTAPRAVAAGSFPLDEEFWVDLKPDKEHIPVLQSSCKRSMPARRVEHVLHGEVVPLAKLRHQPGVKVRK